MMRYLATGLLLISPCLGCNRTEEVRQQAVAETLKKIELALREYHETQLPPASEFTHVMAGPTDYYTTGPQQGRPADGTFSAGTRANIVQEAGPYVLIQTESSGKGYVPTDAIERVESDVMDVSEVVDGGNQFALALYQQLRLTEGNLFFSPSSISTALAMTYAGAAGDTKAEMAKVLHIQMPDGRMHEAMKTLQSFWKTPDDNKGIQLKLANRLWGQENNDFLPQFLAITRDQYAAELARLDFSQSDASRQTINRWVEEQTEEKITDLIPAGVISSDTRLVLTNAVYFHGSWSDPFKKELTKDEDFYLTATEKIKVPLMHRWDEFQYGEIDDLQILELPYGDGSLSMVVLLPKERDGLAELETKLSFQNLQQWMASVKQDEEVKVYLPKFKMTSQFEMSNTLTAMGMPSAFDADTADFSGMTGGKDLFISKVIHKAFVDVNEEGTEAAAATGVMMGVTSAIVEEPKQPPLFRADHPFVFMIRDNRNQAILFVGRIINPS